MIYDMYSRKEIPKERSTLFLIVADKDTLNLVKMPLLQEGMLVNSLHNYSNYIETGNDRWHHALTSRQQRIGFGFRGRSERFLRNKASDIKRYPIWLKSYIGRYVLHKELEQLQVYAVSIDHKYGFNFDQKKIIDVK